jgi:mRNA interferase MazF
VAIPAAGEVVSVRFPFSDLTASKLRPAVVLANVGRDDFILCQITSKPYADPQAIQIDHNSFASGGLPLVSYVRPGKLFSAHKTLINRAEGTLTGTVHKTIVDAIIALLLSPLNS